MTERIEGRAAAVIVAAGRSERMGGIEKVFATLMGRPLIAWTLTAFRKCEEIDEIVVVASPRSVMRMEALVQEWRIPKVRAVVSGGKERQDSVRAGLEETGDAAIVAVHDGARPLVTPELITRGIHLARESGAAICAIPSRETVKEVEGEPPTVRATLDRGRIWLAQTPQVFARDLLVEAHAQAQTQATDDSALLEAGGHTVTVYEGAPWNMKVTAPEDLILAEALLRERIDAAR